MAEKIQIGGELVPMTTDKILGDASTIIDRANFTDDKRQDEINTEFLEYMRTHDSTGSGDSIDYTEVNRLVNVEKTRATNAENTLDDKISSEASRAKASESSLEQKIINETSRAIIKENGLTYDVNSEIVRAKNAEYELKLRTVDLREKIESLIDTDANFRGIFLPTETLPTDISPAWCLVGESLNALSFYILKEGLAEWTIFSDPTYDFTDFSDVKDINSFVDSVDYKRVTLDSDGFVIDGIDRRNKCFHNLKQKFNAGTEGIKQSEIINDNGLTPDVVNDDKFIQVITDKDGLILYGVKKDGSFFWSKGLPEHLRTHIESSISNSIKGNTNVAHSLSVSEENDALFDCDTHIGKFFGIDTLMDYEGQRTHIKDFCEKMAAMGAKTCRIIKRKYYNYQIYDTIFYYLTKNNIDILFSYPIYSSSSSDQHEFTDFASGSTSEDTMLSLMETMIKRYNGSTNIQPWNNLDGNPTLNTSEAAIKITIKYFELTNEFNLGQYGHVKCFDMQKKFYQLVKSVSPSASVMSVTCMGSSSEEKLLYNYIDTDGTAYSTLFDIYNHHIYPENIIDKAHNYYDMFSASMKSKKCWLTETGYNIKDNSENDQANGLVKLYLQGLSYGAEKVFAWTFDSTGNYFNSTQTHGAFGVVGTCSTASYGKFAKANGSEFFPWYSKMHINYPTTRNCYEMQLTNDIIKEIQKNGLVLGGSGYTMTSIVYRTSGGETTLLNQSKTFAASGSDTLVVPASVFAANLYENNFIKVVCSSTTVNNSWVWEPRKAYHALSFLNMIIGEGASVPVLESSDDNVICMSWENGTNTYRCIWANKDVHVRLYGANRAKVYNCIGEEVQFDERDVTLTKDVLIIENANKNLKFRLI